MALFGTRFTEWQETAPCDLLVGVDDVQNYVMVVLARLEYLSQCPVSVCFVPKVSFLCVERSVSSLCIFWFVGWYVA